MRLSQRMMLGVWLLILWAYSYKWNETLEPWSYWIMMTVWLIVIVFFDKDVEAQEARPSAYPTRDEIMKHARAASISKDGSVLYYFDDSFLNPEGITSDNQSIEWGKPDIPPPPPPPPKR